MLDIFWLFRRDGNSHVGQSPPVPTLECYSANVRKKPRADSASRPIVCDEETEDLKEGDILQGNRDFPGDTDKILKPGRSDPFRSLLQEEETDSEMVSVRFNPSVNVEEASTVTLYEPKEANQRQKGRKRGWRKAKQQERSPSMELNDLDCPETAASEFQPIEGDTAKLGTEELAILISQYSHVATMDSKQSKPNRAPDSGSFNADKASDLHFEAGFKGWKQGRVDDALREFVIAVNSGEQQSLGHYMIGLCHLEKGDIWEAVKHFKFGLHGDGITSLETTALYFEIGRAYEKLDDANEANYYYSKIERVDPEFRNDARRFEYGEHLRENVISNRKANTKRVWKNQQSADNKKEKVSVFRTALQKIGF